MAIMARKLARPAAALLLLGGALACLAITGFVIYRYGATVYYLAFHRPFSFNQRAVSYTPVSLPSVTLRPSISSSSLYSGETQVIAATVQVSSDTTGFLEVWVTSPDHKQVYQSPLPSQPQAFQAGKTYSAVFQYHLPSSAAKGKYFVSANVVSASKQVDYILHRNFAAFAVL